MAKRIEKANLPRKICPVCQRPFVWRKAWAKVWDEVRYCSERCRRGAKGSGEARSPDERCEAKVRGGGN